MPALLRRFAAPLASLMLLVATAEAQDIFDRIRINGYTSFEFEKGLGKGNGDPNGSFDADGFDLVLNIHPTERVRAALDLALEHGVATEDSRGNVAMEYGFVEYAFSDLFKVRLGKMFTPFGLYNEIHTAKTAFLSVKEPASLNKNDRIVEGGFAFYPRWGAGIALHGDGVIGKKNFNYDLLIANGEQENTNPFEQDDNGFKSFTLRLRFEPTESLRLGYSLYFDDASDPKLGSLVSNGFEVEWSIGKLRVQGEVGVGSRTPEAGASKTQLGFYVQPSYHFQNGLTPYMRLEVFDTNTQTRDEDGLVWVAGLNYELAKQCHVKLENNNVRGGKATNLAAFPGRDYNEIKAAFVLGF
jgi:phosphate-selective porin